MGNCLVTKLKESVQNDNLNILGVAKFTFYNVTHAATIYSYFGTGLSASDFYGDNIQNVVDDVNPGYKTITLVDSSLDTFDIYVKNKYALENIGVNWVMNKNEFDSLKYYSNLWILGLGVYYNGNIYLESGLNSLLDVKDLTNLKRLSVTDSRITENINVLLPYFAEKLEQLDFCGTIEGSMIDFGKFKKINRINSTGGSLLNGNLEDFVAVQRGLGNIEKSVRTDYIAANQMVKFQGVPCASGVNITLSWTATTITFNGETIQNSDVNS